MKKSLKIVRNIFLVLLAIIIIAAIAVSVIATKNVKAMNSCVDDTIKLIAENHTITELPANDFSEMKAFGLMKFHVKQYDIEELGNLSVMTVNVGLMQMATVVFTPAEKDLPLLSCDYMYILSNRKAYIELYDLVEEKDEEYISWLSKYEDARNKYDTLANSSSTPAWYDDLLTVVTYKTGKTNDDVSLKNLLLSTVEVYLEQADAYSVMTADKVSSKLDIIKNYSDRLIDEGGISTDFFKSAFGADVTRTFFDKVFFGTNLYR